MKLTKEQIRDNFDYMDYQLGVKYYNDELIKSFNFIPQPNGITVNATVQGASLYNVNIYINESNATLAYKCSCQKFNNCGQCKHIVSVLLKYIDEDPECNQSDDTVTKLFDEYLNMYSDSQPSSADKVRLEPILKYRDIGYNNKLRYPRFSFKIGSKRLYSLLNIDAFIANLEEHKTVSYGKDLEFKHILRNFDENSQKMIELFTNVYDENSNTGGWNPSDYYRSPTPNKNAIRFKGYNFDAFFDLYKNTGVATDERFNMDFVEKDPVISLILRDELNYITLMLYHNPVFFGNNFMLYAIYDKVMYRCSRKFHLKVYPFISDLTITDLKISKNDICKFCSCILPEISEYVDIFDNKKILSQYLPNDLSVEYYFDIDNSNNSLKSKVNFIYGDIVIADVLDNKENYDNLIKRDIKKELQSISILEEYLKISDTSPNYYQDDYDKIYDFLTNGIQNIYDYGEVFVSDRLNKLDMPKSKVIVGLSVSNGMLSFDIDTGEFPSEELFELFNSLKEKRKYHKLKDGRFMSLEDSSFEKLSELSNMLQLTNKDFESGNIKMPAFRIPYLDSILVEDDNLKVNRDTYFKEIIRNFRTIDDSDFTINEHFNKILRPYQKTGFKWLKTLDRYGFSGILADDMGLGKTIQVLAYLDCVSKEQKGKVSLIVCPSSLIYNWQDECNKFAPDLKITPIVGSSSERKLLLLNYDKYDIIVTSYELLKRDVDIYVDIDFYCCIIDEAQFVKNTTTAASKAVKHINCEKRFALTGTPIENRLSELWNIFDFLMPGYLYTHNTFVSKLEKPIIKLADEKSMTELSKLVKPFILRRMKNDVLKDLPPKTEHIHKVKMDEIQKKTYFAAVENAKNSLANTDPNNKIQIFAVLTRLRQICCDPSLCFENYKGENCKLDACIDLCINAVEGNHQVLLFSQFTSMLAIIKKKLDEIEISNFTLQGSTSKEKRAELVKDFNNGKASVFLISLKAGGTGLNLTAADIVIHYDPWWNLAAQNQATDRAHRIGQKSRVQVYKLIIQNTIEEKIVELQNKKNELMDTISGNTEGSIMTMSKDDIVALLE